MSNLNHRYKLKYEKYKQKYLAIKQRGGGDMEKLKSSTYGKFIDEKGYHVLNRLTHPNLFPPFNVRIDPTLYPYINIVDTTYGKRLSITFNYKPMLINLGTMNGNIIFPNSQTVIHTGAAFYKDNVVLFKEAYTEQKESILESIKTGTLLKDIDATYQDDIDVVLEAINVDKRQINHASDRLIEKLCFIYNNNMEDLSTETIIKFIKKNYLYYNKLTFRQTMTSEISKEYNNIMLEKFKLNPLIYPEIAKSSTLSQTLKPQYKEHILSRLNQDYTFFEKIPGFLRRDTDIIKAYDNSILKKLKEAPLDYKTMASSLPYDIIGRIEDGYTDIIEQALENDYTLYDKIPYEFTIKDKIKDKYKQIMVQKIVIDPLIYDNICASFRNDKDVLNAYETGILKILETDETIFEKIATYTLIRNKPIIIKAYKNILLQKLEKDPSIYEKIDKYTKLQDDPEILDVYNKFRQGKIN